MINMDRSLSEIHRDIYDGLAEEYKARAELLRQVTEDSIANFAPYITPGGTVLDVGCGSGLAIETLTSYGFAAEGIELAPKMAMVARQQSPESTIITGDYVGYSLSKKYDAALAFAFIHLFPKETALRVLRKLHDDLKTGGVMLIGTTKSEESREGWEAKGDYESKAVRYRKHWRQDEFEEALAVCGFNILDLRTHHDPYGKTWLDYIVRKST